MAGGGSLSGFAPGPQKHGTNMANPAPSLELEEKDVEAPTLSLATSSIPCSPLAPGARSSLIPLPSPSQQRSALTSDCPTRNGH